MLSGVAGIRYRGVNNHSYEVQLFCRKLLFFELKGSSLNNFNFVSNPKLWEVLSKDEWTYLAFGNVNEIRRWSLHLCNLCIVCS